MLSTEPKPGHQSSSAAPFALLAAVSTISSWGTLGWDPPLSLWQGALSSSSAVRAVLGCFGWDRVSVSSDPAPFPCTPFAIRALWHCPALGWRSSPQELLCEHKHTALPRLCSHCQFVQSFQLLELHFSQFSLSIFF